MVFVVSGQWPFLGPSWYLFTRVVVFLVVVLGDTSLVAVFIRYYLALDVDWNIDYLIFYFICRWNSKMLDRCCCCIDHRKGVLAMAVAFAVFNVAMAALIAFDIRFAVPISIEQLILRIFLLLCFEIIFWGIRIQTSRLIFIVWP